MYDLTTSLLNGFPIDETLFYTLLNLARNQREGLRPFKALEKVDTSNIVNPLQNTPLTPANLQQLSFPSDFNYMREDGFLTLYDGNLTWQTYNEIPQNQSIYYLQSNNYFYVDHANRKFYLCGIIDRTYIAYLYYQAQNADISKTTSWVGIPDRFHPILAFDVAAMYRLGVDYDDINARNADSNATQAELMFRAMEKWDDSLQRSAVTRMDYPSMGDVPGFKNRSINIQG